MTTTVKWGILGAGNISAQFVSDLLKNNLQEGREFDHIVESIGSSKSEKAQSFIENLEINRENNGGVIPKAESYEEFYINPKIQIVYVGTIHTLHLEQAKRAIAAGKSVLCEKPLTINSKETKDLIGFAKNHQKYLMEGVWTRFFPAVEKLQHHLFHDRTIGDIRRLFVDFSYNAHLESLPITSRCRDKNLGASALLDIGIYPLTYARILLSDKLGHQQDQPQISGAMVIDDDKVDHSTSMILNYKDGIQAILTCSEYVDGPKEYVRVEGTKGNITMTIDRNPARAVNFKVSIDGQKDPIEFYDESGYIGFIYEANQVARDVNSGLLESQIIPHEETIVVSELLDAVRQQGGLVFPQD